MKDSDYIQCTFKQGDLQYTAYIPAHGAKIGYSMKLEGKEGRWTVATVSNETRIPYDMAKRHEWSHTRQRKASDI